MMMSDVPYDDDYRRHAVTHTHTHTHTHTQTGKGKNTRVNGSFTLTHHTDGDDEGVGHVSLWAA